MVLLVLLKVLGQMIDALRQQRNLHICRSRVPFVQLKIAYCLLLGLHTFSTSSRSKSIPFTVNQQTLVFGAIGVKLFPKPWDVQRIQPATLPDYKISRSSQAASASVSRKPCR